MRGFDGRAVNVPAAEVWLHIGDYSFKHVVAVSKNSLEQALLGLDIGIIDYLLSLEREQREAEVNVTTRAQAKARKNQEQEDADLSERDQAHPTSLEPEVVADLAPVDSEVSVLEHI